jgi:hypothetical protein
MIVHFINRNTRKLEGQVIESNEFPLFPVFCLKKGLYIPPDPLAPAINLLPKELNFKFGRGLCPAIKLPTSFTPTTRFV